MKDFNEMVRISFLNGLVLQDFHLNNLQRNVYKSMKERATKERYDLLMLVSPYNYYYAEAFTTEDNRHQDSTARLNNLDYTINSDQWITKTMELPTQVEEIYLLSEFEDDVEKGHEVEFYYRRGEAESWIKTELGVPIYIPPTTYIQFKINCKYEGTTRPVVYDFAALFK